MKQTDIADIERIVESLSRASVLGPDLRRINVEPAYDGQGGEFLRVSLYLGHPERVTWKLVEPLVTSIEDSVLDVDNRFPSVRFPDPEA